MKFFLLILLTALAYGSFQPSGLDDLKAEPNLEKRARLALEYAEQELTSAKDAYGKGDTKNTVAHLDEIRESVELARASLQETGKNARKRSRPFKYGETKTRDMLKRLDALQNAMDFDDRKLIEPVREKLQEVHEAWLLGIMGAK